ncbi:hypothetical protein ACHQM5_027597 [Ranunculus cassubicifolius]
MAYVPPHKRNSKDQETTPYVDDPRQIPRNYRHNSTSQPHSKWFIVPSIHANQPMKFIKWEDQARDDMLILVSDPHVEAKKQTESTDSNNPTIYVCYYLPRKDFEQRNMEVYEIVNNSVNSPWRCIEKEIQGGLVSALKNLRSEMSKPKSGLVISPSFIVRLGTNFFGGENVLNLESLNNLPFKTALSELYRGHDTHVPSSFTESIRTEVVPKLGLEFHAEKEYYHVTVFDKYGHRYFACKCAVNKAVGELDLCKIGLNPKRHLILDISYLDKKVDPRLMLSAKRVFTTFSTAEVRLSLSQLMKSAIIDPKEKGGLRWPAENNPLFSRYVIDKVLHTTSQVFKSSTMKLKLSNTEEFYYATSAYCVDQPVILEMTEIERRLSDEAAELDPIVGMVRDTLKLLWEHFP